MNTWQHPADIALALLERLRPAYNPAQLELFSARNLEAVSSAKQAVSEQAPALLRVRTARQAASPEDFDGISYGGTCTFCDD